MQATKESAIAVLEFQADSAPLQRFVSQKHCTDEVRKKKITNEKSSA